MGIKKSSKNHKIISEPSLAIPEGPLVFISHDTRDADLAEAFANLLTDASGGMLKSFRSSDRKGTSGIEFGQEWYRAIMGNLAKSTDVVALLTPHSLDRPWILYESGVAKGKLDATVLGVAIGIPLEKAQTGPFAQFQNCGDDEDSLTKLVIQLIRRNPNAAPRDEAVRLQVKAFRDRVTVLLKSRDKAAKPEPKIDDAVIAKMFEEVKILVRDLPDRVQGNLPNVRRKKFRRVHPEMLLELAQHPMFKGREGQGLPLLIYLSFLRDDFPWIYELGLELYRALQKGSERDIERTHLALRRAMDMLAHGPIFFEMFGESGDEESFMFFRHFTHDFGRFIHRTLSRRQGKAPAEEESKAD